jgi:hypothetical protein
MEWMNWRIYVRTYVCMYVCMYVNPFAHHVIIMFAILEYTVAHDERTVFHFRFFLVFCEYWYLDVWSAVSICHPTPLFLKDIESFPQNKNVEDEHVNQTSKIVIKWTNLKPTLRFPKLLNRYMLSRNICRFSTLQVTQMATGYMHIMTSMAQCLQSLELGSPWRN